MSGLSLSALVFGPTALALGIFTLIKSPTLPNRFWAYFNFLVFWWAVSYFMLGVVTTTEAADFWLRFGMIGGMLLSCIFYHFVCLFTGIRTPKFLIFAYTQAIINTVLYETRLIHSQIVRISGSYYYFHAIDWTFLSILILWNITVLYSFVILYRGLRVANDNKKQQIKYIMFAMAIGFASGGVFHFSTVYGLHAPPLLNLGIFFYIAIASFGIFRHGLFDIVIIIKKGLVYTLLVSAFTITYVSALFLIEHHFQRSLGYRSFLFTCLFIAAIALLAEPLRVGFQSLIDNIFFKGSINKLHDQKRLLEAEMLKQDRLKAVATLAAGMAHEIKNPLTSIRTFAEYLPEKYSDPEFRSKFKKIVVDEVDRVNSIVQQLLDFSKPREPELKPVSITDILDETLGLITSKLLDNKIAVSREFQASPEIMADRNQLKQAFLNLFLNSIQAMPQGGTLTVSTSLSGGHRLLVSAGDTGVGIPKDSITHIFDPFYTTKEAGTGLGLSIVHGIVLKHKGKISVESRQNSGTKFGLVFPVK